jgi:hypothetical protein
LASLGLTAERSNGADVDMSRRKKGQGKEASKPEKAEGRSESDISASSFEAGVCGGGGPLRCYHYRKDPEGNLNLIGEVHRITTRYAFLNGILSDQKNASELAVYHLDKTLIGEDISEFTLLHNPTDKFLKDGVETMKDKFRHTDAAKQVSRVLGDIQQSGEMRYIVAHSQGGQILASALKYHVKNSDQKLTNIRVQFHAGSNNKLFTKRWVRKSGVQTFGSKGGYINGRFDLVPNVIGLNTINPIKIIGSILSAPKLFMDRDTSPHSPNCSTEGCKELDK